MSIYSVIYIILIVILAAYTICHKIDLLSVAAVCFIVYSIYCIPGIGISGTYKPHLSPNLYYLIYSQCILILLFSFFVRQKEKTALDERYNSEYTKKASPVLIRSFYIYTFIIVVFAALNIVRIGFSGFAAGKANVWAESNILFIISLYGAYPSFAFGLHNRIKAIWIPSLLVELTIFFAGSRAFATTMAVIFLCERGSRLLSRNKKNIRLYIIGAVAVVFLLMYRLVDEQIMAGDFSGVLSVLSQPESWFKALEFNEPRVIIANYDLVVASNFRLPIGDTRYRLLDFIPGLTALIPIQLVYPDYFSNWLQEAVHAVRGVGGTIWGESYAMFGGFGVLFFTLLWLFVLYKCNKHLDYHSPVSYFVMSLGVYYAWYINRLDFNLVGQAFKVFLLCFVIWAVPYLALGGAVNVFKLRVRL